MIVPDPNRRVRVLLVEDHPAVAQTMQMLLESLGASAELAPDVKGARARLEAGEFDLVLADYRLPDGAGTEVLEAAGDRAPVRVLLSAYSDLEGGENYRVESKPIEPERVSALLSEARSAREGSQQ